MKKLGNSYYQFDLDCWCGFYILSNPNKKGNKPRWDVLVENHCDGVYQTLGKRLTLKHCKQVISRFIKTQKNIQANYEVSR